VISIKISGPLDREMPRSGLLTLEDPETEQKLMASASFSSFRTAWASWHEERTKLWEAICRRSGAACLELSTADDAPAVLMRFFRKKTGARVASSPHSLAASAGGIYRGRQ